MLSGRANAELAGRVFYGTTAYAYAIKPPHNRFQGP